MKIDSDLRAAIRSAEKAQPANASSSWEVRERNEKESIATFLKKFPKKARSIRTLVAKIELHSKLADDAQEQLCKSYGLRKDDQRAEGVSFSRCGEGKDAFVKAGGAVTPVKEKWSADHVIAELAAAEPKQMTTILKKYGINWK